MTPVWLSEEDARERLARKVAEHGSQTNFAKVAGCSVSLVSAALLGRKPIGPKLGASLGLVAASVRTYQYLDRPGSEGAS